MTVEELIEKLKEMPQDAQIAVMYDVEPFINDSPKSKDGVELGTVIL